MNIERFPLRRTLASVFLFLLLFGSELAFGAFRPRALMSFMIPGTILALAIIWTRMEMHPLLRLGLTALVCGVIFILIRSTFMFFWPWIAVGTTIWGIGQIGLVLAGGFVKGGSMNPVLTALHRDGYALTFSRALSGVFGAPVAMMASLRLWLLLIGFVSLLLWRGDGLDAIEAALFARAERDQRSDVPHSMLVTLTTPDNNQQKYLTTALELCRSFQRAGALVTCFPRKAKLDSLSASIADSILAGGGFTYPMAFPRREEDLGWSYRGVYIRYQAIDVSPFTGKTQLHPALTAVSIAQRRPIRMSPQLLQNFMGASSGRASGAFADARLLLGDQEIPIESDGTSGVLFATSWSPQTYGVDRTRFLADCEKVDWDSALTYFDLITGERVHSLPDSMWGRAKGQMVFIDWQNKGDDFRRHDASIPSLIADRIPSGHTVRFAPLWGPLAIILVLILAPVLFARTSTSVFVAAMMGCMIGLGWLEARLFAHHLLVTHLIYGAFAALLAGVILPLVRLPSGWVSTALPLEGDRKVMATR